MQRHILSNSFPDNSVTVFLHQLLDFVSVLLFSDDTEAHPPSGALVVSGGAQPGKVSKPRWQQRLGRSASVFSDASESLQLQSYGKYSSKPSTQVRKGYSGTSPLRTL